MKIYFVQRANDSVIVTVMRNKNDNTFSFVNLSKEHVCPCRFSTEEEAWEDLERERQAGKVLNYFELNRS